MSSVRYSACIFVVKTWSNPGGEGVLEGCEAVYCPASTACHYLCNACYGEPGRGKKSVLRLEGPAWFSRGRVRVVVSPEWFGAGAQYSLGAGLQQRGPRI